MIDRSDKRRLVGDILALTAAVAFAFANASASVAFQDGSNPITLAAVRFVLPALVLAAWLSMESRSIWLPRRDGWIAASLGAVTAAYTWALLSAIGTIPLALAILLFYLFPLVATVILAIFGWETLSWKTIAAIVVAFIGLVLALDPRVGNVNVKGVLQRQRRPAGLRCRRGSRYRRRGVQPGVPHRRFTARSALYRDRSSHSACRVLRAPRRIRSAEHDPGLGWICGDGFLLRLRHDCILHCGIDDRSGP